MDQSNPGSGSRQKKIKANESSNSNIVMESHAKAMAKSRAQFAPGVVRVNPKGGMP
ncbi:MAG: hypothetical protein PHF70_09080 [Opitutales bacterium]|nr:hypothetical protein [Opitutales bacterium]